MQAHDMPTKPDAIVTVCGGGGLAMGILQGLEDVGWESVRVLVAETAGAESLNASLRAGRLVTLPKISSVARSLGALTVSERFFNKCMELGEPKVCVRVFVRRARVILVVILQACVCACA
jgi:threonine dehydratase